MSAGRNRFPCVVLNLTILFSRASRISCPGKLINAKVWLSPLFSASRAGPKNGCTRNHHGQYVTCDVIVIVITNQDSTSSRLLPGSSYSCCIRNLHALVHKQCHPVHITTAHEILQRRKWQLCNRRSRLTTAVAGHEKRRWASSSTGRSCIPKAAHRLQPRANQTTP
jgi:hypothetical protein